MTSILSDKQLDQALSSMSAELFSNRLYDDDGFFPLLASIHYSTSGRHSAREAFIKWAATDNAYNTNHHKQANRAMWNTCNKRSGSDRKYTDRSLQWILRKYATDLQPSFCHAIEVSKVRNRFKINQ